MPRFCIAALSCLFALAIGTSYVYGGLLPRRGEHLIPILAPLAAAGSIGAFYLGLRGSTAVRASRRLAAGLIAATLFAALVALPAGLRWIRLARAAATFPPPPGATKIAEGIDVVRFDPVTDFCRHCITRRPASEVEEFYRQRLAGSDWSLAESTTDIHSPTIHFYRHGTNREGRRLLTFRRGKELLAVATSEKGGETFVALYYYDPDWSLAR